MKSKNSGPKFFIVTLVFCVSWFVSSRLIADLQAEAMHENLTLFDSMLRAESGGKIRVQSSTMARNGSEYGSSEYVWIRVDALVNIENEQGLQLVENVVEKFNLQPTHRAILQTECKVLEIDHGQLITIAPGEAPAKGQARVLLYSTVAPMTPVEMLFELGSH
jgi:hypothetical protein